MIVRSRRKYRRSDKDLSGDAAVHMQLVIILSANPDLNPDRREHSGKRRRCQKYLAEQGYRFAVIAHRDPAHIPQYRPLRIENGGADKQNAALDPLSGDLLEKSIVHVFRDQTR